MSVSRKISQRAEYKLVYAVASIFTDRESRINRKTVKGILGLSQTPGSEMRKGVVSFGLYRIKLTTPESGKCPNNSAGRQGSYKCSPPT